ncbi:reverse transcriptase domain-containing protein [Tanacetum coccineum]
MSTRSSFSSLIPPFFDPESVIRNQRRNLDDFSRLLDFEEISMNPNNVQGPPPAGLPPQNHNGPPGSNLHMPVPDLCTMEELCQPTMNGRGGSIALVNIQATDFGLKNHMIQQEMASKFLSKYFPPSMVTKLRNDINNFCQLLDESLFKAWERYKLSIDQCPNHNMGESSSSITSSSSEIAALTHQIAKMREDILQITIRVPPLVVQSSPVFGSFELPPAPSTSFVIPEQNLHQPQIPYPSRLNKEKLQDKSDIQIHSFLQMIKKLHFNISFSKALAYMPKYAKMAKDLLTNKEKLFELVNTSLNENCSAVLLKKLPEKFGDTERFLIPYKLQELESCMSLADQRASINIMPLSVWEKLTLLELTPTRMTLELATRAVAYLVDIAKDVFVKVGKFTFPADFVVVDYDIDP